MLFECGRRTIGRELWNEMGRETWRDSFTIAASASAVLVAKMHRDGWRDMGAVRVVERV